MTDSFKDYENQAVVGHCIDVMRRMPDGCIDCVVTSPPYFGLRDYGIPPVDWPEVVFAPMPGLPPMTVPAETSVHGLEKDIWAYVAHEVLVFREVRRVLAPHGCIFINLGDAYSSGNRATYRSGASDNKGHRVQDDMPRPIVPSGLKPKDLLALPWRVALSLQADGFYLRSACPWVKRNSMPESCTDRPASSLEYVFILTKNAKYYWDAVAVKRPVSEASTTRLSQESFDEQTGGPKDYGHRTNDNRSARKALCNLKEKLVAQEKWGDRYDGWKQRDKSLGRNLRNSDWFFDSWQGMLLDSDGGPMAFIVNPQATPEAHFATFGERLITPMLLAGCPREVCVVCGRPRERILEKNRVATRPGENTKIKVPGGWDTAKGGHGSFHREGRGKPEYRDVSVVGNRDPQRHCTESQTIGWTDCGCGQGFRPGRVLDPFGGSGTVGAVAARMKLTYTLIDANPSYVADIAKYRLQEAEVGLPVEEARNGQLPLFPEGDGRGTLCGHSQTTKQKDCSE